MRGHNAAFAGVLLHNDEMKYRGEKVSTRGAQARVESSGDVEKRVTATRVLTTGLLALAWQKKEDNRAVYLTIEGEGFGWVVPVDPKDELKARQFAAKVNAAASARVALA